jgi:hypothetical protein
MNKLLIAALCATSMTAHAEFWDGNKLLQRMNGSTFESMSASSYVAGVADALNGVVYCAPSPVTLGQIVDMTKRALEQSPEKRHLPADIFVSSTLTKAWPCPARS